MGSQPWIIPAVRKVGKGHLDSVLTLVNAGHAHPSATAAVVAVSCEALLSWANASELGAQPFLLGRGLGGWDLSSWVLELRTFPGRAVASVSWYNTVWRRSPASFPTHSFKRQSYSRAHHL